MQWIKPCWRQKFCNWHPWFAWRPVTVKKYEDGAKKRCWMEKIQRRFLGYHFGPAVVTFIYEYREIPNQPAGDRFRERQEDVVEKPDY